jgi:hypothetical protein
MTAVILVVAVVKWCGLKFLLDKLFSIYKLVKNSCFTQNQNLPLENPQYSRSSVTSSLSSGPLTPVPVKKTLTDTNLVDIETTSQV